MSHGVVTCPLGVQRGLWYFRWCPHAERHRVCNINLCGDCPLIVSTICTGEPNTIHRFSSLELTVAGEARVEYRFRLVGARPSKVCLVNFLFLSTPISSPDSYSARFIPKVLNLAQTTLSSDGLELHRRFRSYYLFQICG